MSIRLLIAERYANVSFAVIRQLVRNGDVEIVGEASTGFQVIALTHKMRPDVVLVHDRLNDMSAVEVTRAVKRAAASAEVIILAESEEEEDILETVQAGARGFLSKGASGEVILTFVRRVASGGVALTDDTMAKLVNGIMHSSRDDPADGSILPIITEREREILCLVAQGTPNKRIAFLLAMSENTVRVHVRSLMQKLDADNRTQLAVYALRSGLGAGAADGLRPRAPTLLPKDASAFEMNSASKRSSNRVPAPLTHTAA